MFGGDDERIGVGGRFGRRERVVDGAGGAGAAFLADAAREVALGIDVDEQDATLGEGEGGGEVDGGGGFADASFLVGDGHDFGHKVFISVGYFEARDSVCRRYRNSILRVLKF